MAIEIRMPRLSQTTDDVKLVSWLVKEGDTVKKGDPLCEVETDKATMPVESYGGGTVLRIVGEPDTVISAGTLIAVLGAPGEKIAVAIQQEAVPRGAIPIGAAVTGPARRDTAGVTEPAAAGATGRVKDGIKATPLVRNIAHKLGIDLSNVFGTGPRGLITKKDLEEYRKGGGRVFRRAAQGRAAQGGASQVARAAAGAGVDGSAAAGAAEHGIAAPVFAPAGELKAVSLSRNQMLVGRNLSRSKREAPHYYLKCTVFMDREMKWREENRGPDGSKVSVYSLFVYAAARALRALPKLNGFFKDERLVLFDEVNVGCAVTAGDDLFVPVVKAADRKGPLEIDRELKWLVAKAQSGKLEAADLLGGTFTLTNLGMYPVDEFCAVINPPQAGVLAIARAKKVLDVDEDDRISIRNACTVTGSFDHRVVNGAQGAEFLKKVKEIMEEGIV